MRFPRSSGVLLHVSSLPSCFGIGDFGENAYEFVNFLQRAGQRIWQILPLGPPAIGNSPYSCYSAFAGNPLLISPSRLVADGLLAESEIENVPSFPRNEVDFQVVEGFKGNILEKSLEYFIGYASNEQRNAYSRFYEANRWWLDDFALFAALLHEFEQRAWSQWDPDLVRRQPKAIEHWQDKLRDRIRFELHVQFVFHQQWDRLKSYANERGVKIFGDMPLFVAYNSADVWVNQDLFYLDEDGQPTVVAGVPPDCFSETGQRWGNPLFRWDRLAASGFSWWKDRFRSAFSSFDMLRIDHFRGFESYWEIPASEETAISGRWVKGPGSAPLLAAQDELGELRIVAEDLGMITSEVHQLRDEIGLPGMRVIQFGFDQADDIYHRPDSFPHHCVGYTGTHDNDTIVGWYRQQMSQGNELIQSFLKTDGSDVHWELIGHLLESDADTVIVPLQDILGLDSNDRMNSPGKPDGNWKWRFCKEQLNSEIEERLRDMVDRTGRLG